MKLRVNPLYFQQCSDFVGSSFTSNVNGDEVTTLLKINVLKSLGKDLEDFVVNTLGLTFEDVFIDNTDRQFIANSEDFIDITLPFNKYYIFNLLPTATIDEKGDVVKVEYRKQGEDAVAIEETRSYVRTQVGQVPNDVLTMKETISIKYFRRDGSFIENNLPERQFNEYDRKTKDRKARANVIEQVREATGDFIISFVVGKVQAGQVAPQDAEATIFQTAQEALTMLESLNDQISAYRDDRQSLPLLTALDSYTRTTLLTDEIIGFIRESVNIDYYVME